MYKTKMFHYISCPKEAYIDAHSSSAGSSNLNGPFSIWSSSIRAQALRYCSLVSSMFRSISSPICFLLIAKPE